MTLVNQIRSLSNMVATILAPASVFAGSWTTPYTDYQIPGVELGHWEDAWLDSGELNAFCALQPGLMDVEYAMDNYGTVSILGYDDGAPPQLMTPTWGASYNQSSAIAIIDCYDIDPAGFSAAHIQVEVSLFGPNYYSAAGSTVQ